MATKLKEIDVVIVGLGWTGGILAKELTEAGLKVVALERGALRTSENDYSLPNIRDELRYVVRHDLMQNTARDTITVRNNPTQDALPMRRLGSFLPGEVVGGSGVHWSGHTWRWTDMEFRIRLSRTTKSSSTPPLSPAKPATSMARSRLAAIHSKRRARGNIRYRR